MKDFQSMFLESMDFHEEGKTQRRDLCKSQLLPTKMRCPLEGRTGDARVVLGAWGVQIGEKLKDDELFTECKLPEGWAVKPTNHAMWCDLVDDKGRKRAAIFYKASIVGRKAHIDVLKRFSIVGRYEADEKCGEQLRVEDTDGVVVFTSKLYEFPPEYADDEARKELSDDETRKLWEAVDEIRAEAVKECEMWLKEHWPEWRDETMYWDL